MAAGPNCNIDSQVRALRDQILDSLPTAGTLEKAVEVVRKRLATLGVTLDACTWNEALQAAEEELKGKIE